EDALEIGIAGRCRESYAELAMRHRDASGNEEIERNGKQCDDCGVVWHNTLRSNIIKRPCRSARHTPLNEPHAPARRRGAPTLQRSPRVAPCLSRMSALSAIKQGWVATFLSQVSCRTNPWKNAINSRAIASASIARGSSP